MNTATVSSQLRQMWDTRPLRARSAPMAGVCTGFARRYQVDVALVRAALIGATVLGGLGLFVYIAAIFALPKEPETGYVEQDRNGPTNFALFIAAGLAVMFGGSLSSSWPGAGLISVALLALGWYALHQRLPEPPPGTAVSNRVMPASPVGAWQPPASQFPWQNAWQPSWQPQQQAPQQHDPQQQEPQQTGPQQTGHKPSPTAEDAAENTTATEEIKPPLWDPLGAAPFAWDLPEPASATELVTEPAPPKSRITPVTLGAALIGAAAMAAVNLTGVAHLSPLLIASVALGILGAGLVYGAFRKTGYGLLFAAIPLAGLVVIGATATNVMSGLADAPRGDRTYTVTDAASLQERYELQAGNLNLDMTGLTLDRDRTVSTELGAGNTKITVPESMNIEVHCAVNLGDTQCPDGRVAGIGAKADAPTLTINAQNRLGNVEVHRVR